jgi:hypothetical protein
MNKLLFERILDLSGITEAELLLEASKEPADFIVKKIKNIEFPGQYLRWITIKLAKDFKENLARRDSLNRTKLVAYAYEELKPENIKMADFMSNKDMASNLFSDLWDSSYQEQIISIRDWITGSNEGESKSFKDYIKTKKLEEIGLKEASILSKQWHDELLSNSTEVSTNEKDIIEDNEVIKVYPDFYWVDIKKNRCSREDGVGCGTDSKADTIFTLKDRRSRKPVISVSVKYGKVTNTYLQAKAAYGDESNIPVKPEHYKYVEDLFKIKNITRYNGAHSHRRENDFKLSDVTDKELLKKIEDANVLIKQRVKEILGDKIEEDEDIEIVDDNQVSIKYKIDDRALSNFVDVYSDGNYSIEEVLKGEADDRNRSDYEVRDAWYVLDDVKINSEGYEQDVEIFDLIGSKMEGAIYKDDGEYHIFGDGHEEKMDKDINLTMRNILENAEVIEMKDILDVKSFETLIMRKKITVENLTRMYDLKTLIEDKYWQSFYVSPLENYGGYYNDSDDDGNEKREELGIDLDYGSDGVTITMGIELLSEIIGDIDGEIYLKSIIADYFNDNELRKRIYINDVDEYSEKGYLANWIAESILDNKQYPDLSIPGVTNDMEKPDHPSQLRFPGMQKEEFERILDLAGLFG